MSTIEQALITYPSAPWDWNAVSCNPSVSFKFILDHPELPWNPVYVSRNKSLTESDVRNNPSYAWDYQILSGSPNISFAFINELIIKPQAVRRVNWQLISANASVSLLDIMTYDKYPWDHQYLSANPNITSNFILNEGIDFDWFIPFVSSNCGITAKDIFKCALRSLFEWSYRNLSCNPNLPVVYVGKNLDKDWNYCEISRRSALVDIEQYCQIPWDHCGLSMNESMTLNYIKTHPGVSWHFPSLLSNSSLRFDEFDYEWVSANWKDSNPFQYYLCSNSSISLAWVKKNKGSIDWKRLSNNPW